MPSPPFASPFATNFAPFFAKNESILHPNSKPPSKAVLVGINYDAWPMYKLKGCHADVASAEDFLIKIGTKKESIRVITDKANRLAPTKAIILEAFDWLKADAKDGDVLYLHFSGHGVEMDPPENNPQNRASSKAICPIDLFHADVDEISQEWEFNNMPFVNPIMGEDFETIFGHLEHTKVNLTVVYDCCHSTGALRALGAGAPSAEPKKTAVRGINIPETMKVSKLVSEKAEATRGAMDKEFEQRYSLAEQNPPYVIGFAAAQGWEFAIDARTANGPCGAFSHFFYALLRKDAKDVNSQGIIDSVTDSLRKNGYTQTPSLTTTRKTVPFFADLTKDLANSEKLSLIKFIQADRLLDEKLLLQFANKTKAFFRKLFNLKDPDAIEKDSSNEAGRDLPSGQYKPGGKKKKGKGDPSKPSESVTTDDERKPKKELVKEKNLKEIKPPETFLPAQDNKPKKLTKAEKDLEEVAHGQLQQWIEVYDELSSDIDLRRLRVQDRVLFDALIKPAIDFSYHVASTALAYKDYTDVGKHTTVLQHLPTAINFLQQLQGALEFEGNDALIAKVFYTTMPIILSTAKQLCALYATTPSILVNDEAELGLFDFVLGKLPLILTPDLFNLMGARRNLARVDEDLIEALERCPPIILQVAHSLAASKKSLPSFLFTPQDTHNEFFESLLNVAKMMLSDPIVREKERFALRVGIKSATRTILHDPLWETRSTLPVKTEAGERARRYLGAQAQTMIHTAIKSIQRARAPPTMVETNEDFGMVHYVNGAKVELLSSQESTILQVAAELVQNIMDPSNVEMRKKIFFQSNLGAEFGQPTASGEIQLYTPGALADVSRANGFYGKYETESIYPFLVSMYAANKKKPKKGSKGHLTKGKSHPGKLKPAKAKAKASTVQPMSTPAPKPADTLQKYPQLTYYM